MSDSSRNVSAILSPTYDFKLNRIAMLTFFSSFKSTRSNKFNSNLEYSSISDYSLDALFYLPCFDQISSKSYQEIGKRLNQQWSDLYAVKSKTIKSF